MQAMSVWVCVYFSMCVIVKIGLYTGACLWICTCIFVDGSQKYCSSNGLENESAITDVSQLYLGE